MGILQRLRRLPSRRRAVLAIAVSSSAAVALVLAGKGASTGASAASAAAARYAALDSQEPAGLTLTSASARAGGQSGTPRPSWPMQAPDGTGTHWPDASTIRRLPLSVPGLSGWIAASLEGGICVLVYDAAATGSDPAVYSDCSPEGRLDQGASVDVSELPGSPGMTVQAGVVPDGVTAVTATLADGRTETLPVLDNAWARESEDPIAAGHAPAWTTGG